MYFSVQFPLTQVRIKPYHAIGLFPNPHKISENQRFSGVFREYRKRPVAGNGLMKLNVLSNQSTLTFSKISS